MEFKGTQGPWVKHDTESYAEILGSDGTVLAMVRTHDDARLIAAAPDLLQALIYAVNFGSKGEIDDDGPHQGMSVSFFTESAIKKALGESS